MSKYYKTKENVVFDTIVNLVMIFTLLVCFLPFVYMAALSFSSSKAIINNQVLFSAVLHPLLGTAHFGGSHQLHSLGDLHGTLYAFDAQLDVLHGTCHALRLLPFNAP